MIYQLNHSNTVPSLRIAMDHCKTLIGLRLQAYFDNGSFDPVAWLKEQYQNEPPNKGWLSFIPLQEYTEWLVVMLTLAPHVYPNFFESLIVTHLPSGGDFPEFGGVKAANHRGMLPTGETIQFIIAGDDVDKRLQLQELFRETHFFYRQGILWLEPVKEGEPVMSGRIVLPQENIERILFGRESAPRYGLDFPAKQIVTAMEWNDVVLHPRTMQQVKDISTWLNHHHRFAEDNNLKRKIKPGYRVLFYGPSGTGKTLTAALLGKEFGKDVYRIDLSQIVSKYIGETEKNLEAVFKRAESKDWILFFDEADALFGKRTSVQSSHDKYANQEVSYLLQRVEDYPGLLILASNFKNNLDEAFLRRFHSVVHFPMPNTAERHHLWKKTMPAGLQHDGSVNLLELADQFELTGASILNAVQFATLQSYARGDGKLLQSDLLEGVKKEFLKEEKSF
ncbi:ATPase family associated with various cellular activities (AAA) [Hydrobacter penzbergensis]|uniref:ATPase family associated with various cellular activities (AAA) n=1 Tax=Hydrobacter penzbergensis TaxID=1235997 RepID=A0A8X8LCN5_9BACT|nr:ATP-binding protein [Hydrobacter penzbergensis]SDX51065.1 ATPase family associated with various cellular activities (AAA) [Hydrobacter penzbergensis]